MTSMTSRILLVILLLALTACTNKSSSEQPAYTAEQSLAAMEFSEDFHAEVFLKEPNVMSPVEMVFDEDGRIYVAEMLDYPDDPPPGKPVRSRIRLLEDVDGDGKYEKAVVFADQVLQVSGLLPWKGGLFVTSAPDILWMKDDNGDGKADTKKVWYTGFPKVNPEARITNLRLGIDNWIYAANHGRDGTITSPEFPQMKPLLVRGADFRFNPLTGEAEATSGVAQFGLTFDEWGNRFITENTIHLRHVVLPMHYIARAPLLEVPAYSYDISDHGKPSAQMFPLTGPQEWRKQRTELRQKRYDEQGLNRKEIVSGYFTAASGSMFYNGDAWPEDYKQSIFTGDVSGNLVHRDVITPDGVTFKASRAKDGTEFIASKDQWFRPCNFANAPDGNLYVMDVYRLFIETPESIPEEIKKGMDFYAGDTMGRIYKIVSNKPRTNRNLKPNLSKATTEELVKLLEHPNGWHRTTAQRLLLERQDKAAVPTLKQMAEQTQAAASRTKALWMLAGLSALEEALVVKALQDKDAQLREQGLRLAEVSCQNLSHRRDAEISQSFAEKPTTTSLRTSSPPRLCGEIESAILSLKDDKDSRVQFQLALTLGNVKDKRAFDALVTMAAERSNDQWFRLAILSSVADSAAQFFQALRAKHPNFENKDMLAQLGSLIGAKHDGAEMTGFIKGLQGLKEPEAGLNGLAKGLNLANVKNLPGAGIEAALLPFLNHTNEAVSKAAWETARFFELQGLIDKALADLAKAAVDPKKKVSAIRALRGGQFAAVAPVLNKVLASSEPGEVKAAAVESLASFDDEGVASSLLAAWASYTPEVRAKALEAMLSEKERMKVLLRALEENKVEKNTLGEEMRARLYEHPEQDVAERAKALFKGSGDDRGQAVEKYKDVLKLNGDQARGKPIFEQHCAKCHLPQKGGRIGADLSGVNNKTKDELLTSILNPSYAIEPRFVNYIVTTNDGRIRSGILQNETPGAITLRALDGDTTILRKNIKEMKASQMSLMPGAFEMFIDKQGMADLIAYLRAGL
ncbi:MAG TPA: PVC-type heme-binding CxxCH protein [Blastocatellia bacterium]|nr:PVC-type heme-binding CxxCH protein [Blastocatellia bacterium]